MPFSKTPQAIETQIAKKVIQRIVEVPKFKTVEVQRAKIVEKNIEVKVPVFVDYNVPRPVFKDRIITVTDVKVNKIEQEVIVPIFREKVVEVPRYIEKVIEVPKFVEKLVPVERLKIVEKVRIVEVPYEVKVPKIVEQEVIVNRPKFRERIVDVIKPKYKCQKCGHEV